MPRASTQCLKISWALLGTDSSTTTWMDEGRQSEVMQCSQAKSHTCPNHPRCRLRLFCAFLWTASDLLRLGWAPFTFQANQPGDADPNHTLCPHALKKEMPTQTANFGWHLHDQMPYQSLTLPAPGRCADCDIHRCPEQGQKRRHRPCLGPWSQRPRNRAPSQLELGIEPGNSPGSKRPLSLALSLSTWFPSPCQLPRRWILRRLRA